MPFFCGTSITNQEPITTYVEMSWNVNVSILSKMLLKAGFDRCQDVLQRRSRRVLLKLLPCKTENTPNQKRTQLSTNGCPTKRAKKQKLNSRSWALRMKQEEGLRYSAFECLLQWRSSAQHLVLIANETLPSKPNLFQLQTNTCCAFLGYCATCCRYCSGNNCAAQDGATDIKGAMCAAKLTLLVVLPYLQ